MLTDPNYVRDLQSHLHTALDTDSGKEIIRFMENLCGWYDFNETDPNKILVAHGKRQVLATIKTLLKLKPDQIVAIAKKEL